MADSDLIELPGGGQVTIGELRRLTWETGMFLEERLDPLQLELDQMFDAMPPRTRMFALMSRKIGKSYGMMAYADKKARKNRDWIIRIAFPTETQGKTIILPILQELQRDCPEDLRWQNRESTEKCWVLPHTNSRLYLAGTDSAPQIDRLRGPRANLVILDEVPVFHGDLKYLIDSVLWPQLLGTGGIMLMSGTPPRSLDHESIKVIERAKKFDRLITKTIFDNPRLGPEDIKLICEEANPDYADDPEAIQAILNGEKEGSSEWEREFLCRMVSDKTARVVPEFDDSAIASEIQVPGFCVRFVALDPGHVADFFGAVFGVLDFAAQQVLILRDYQSRKKPSDEIKADLEKIEKELGWDNPYRRHPKELFNRWTDPSNPQQETDFNAKGYHVTPAHKVGGKDQLVIELRNLFNAGKIKVHVKCADLIAQLKHGVWSDTARVDFARSRKLGHLDTLDALAQGVNMLKALGRWSHNPAPPGVYALPGKTSMVHATYSAPEKPLKRAISRALGLSTLRGRFNRG